VPFRGNNADPPKWILCGIFVFLVFRATGIVTNRTVAGALDSIEFDEGNRDSEGVGYKLFPVDELSRPVRHEYASEAKVTTYTSGLILAARIFGDLHDVYPVA
jgi:hypothetical protein